MTHQNPPEHFKGKAVAEHLKDARLRGAMASSETHGQELSGSFYSMADSGKEAAILFLLLWAMGGGAYILPLGIGLLIWKTGRSALLGWARLERLHRVIEEERFEIEHHREQEKEELKEMYEAKGFSGKLLDEVVEVLMADDNRLLQVMLEEELGLTLEAHEHPLKQASGACLGTLLSFGLAFLAHFFWPALGVPFVSLLLVLFFSRMTALKEKREPLKNSIWNLSLALFSGLCVYFFVRLIG